MCGLLGYFSERPLAEEELRKLRKGLKLISHRGPDGEGEFTTSNVYFGHRRLSIIDLSDNAAQPFFSSCGKLCIIFNGEIYNYREISGALCLRTSSDTEVLLEGYRQFGTAFFSRLRGMYGFAICDMRENKNLIVVGRDPSGIKPLYFYAGEKSFAFASEIKALLPLLRGKLSINHEVLKLYLHLGYVLEPETIYKEITCLIPGSLVTLSMDSCGVKVHDLNKYSFDKINDLPVKVNLMKTKDLLDQAVKRNLVSDVKLNIALSGGIDSSIIYALCNKVTPTLGITVKFSDRKHDESEVAALYAKYLNGEHAIIDVEVDGRLEQLDKLLLHFDQPYADSSLIPFYFLCKYASQHSKVLIGGDGGDEIHNGYTGHQILPGLFAARKIIPHTLFDSAHLINGNYARILTKGLGFLKTMNIHQLLFEWGAWFPSNKQLYPIQPFKYDTTHIYEKLANGSSLNDRLLIQENYFTKRLLSDYLRKSDMMAMYCGLEFRTPMLDEDLVEFSLSIPYEQKCTLLSKKKILRTIHSTIYPPKTSTMPKKGFTIPLDVWLGRENLTEIQNELLRSDGIVLEFMNYEYIGLLFRTLSEKGLQKFCSRASAYQRILILYALQKWYFNNN